MVMLEKVREFFSTVSGKSAQKVMSIDVDFTCQSSIWTKRVYENGLNYKSDSK